MSEWVSEWMIVANLLHVNFVVCCTYQILPDMCEIGTGHCNHHEHMYSYTYIYIAACIKALENLLTFTVASDFSSHASMQHLQGATDWYSVTREINIFVCMFMGM